MNREIKFRGLCSATNQWVYGLPYTETTISHMISGISQYFGEQRKFGRQNVSIINESIGQFTGLQDANGVDIYEGDILANKEGAMIMKVEWHDKYSSFCLTNPKWAYKHFFGEAIEANKTIVFGNIHQNPELLNAGK